MGLTLELCVIDWDLPLVDWSFNPTTRPNSVIS